MHRNLTARLVRWSSVTPLTHKGCVCHFYCVSRPPAPEWLFSILPPGSVKPLLTRHFSGKMTARRFLGPRPRTRADLEGLRCSPHSASPQAPGGVTAGREPVPVGAVPVGEQPQLTEGHAPEQEAGGEGRLPGL